MNLDAALPLIAAQLETSRQQHGIPGLSTTLVHDQRILWSGGIGVARTTDEARADQHTIYRVGSVTKLFTATMLLQLRDAGKLQLDDPIERYIPAFKLRSPFRDARPPTFRQVASHMAGLPRELPIAGWDRFEAPTSEQILARLQEAEMILPPMIHYKYSNIGYTVLGHALEVIAQQPYTEYVVKHILHPLGMCSSGFTLPQALQSRGAHATFPPPATQLVPAHYPDMGAYAPMGQLFASAEDLGRFIMLQFRKGPQGDNQLLNGGTLREMHAPVWMDASWTFGTAIGWRLGRLAKRTILTHDGLVHGFSADVTVVPELKLGIAVCANAMADVAMISRTILEPLIDLMDHACPNQYGTQQVESMDGAELYVGHYRVPGLVELEILLADQRLIGRVSAPFRADLPLTPEGDHRFRMHGGPFDGEILVFNLDKAGWVEQLIAAGFVFERA